MIPVLLPNALSRGLEELTRTFVGLRTWVDFRAGWHDAHALHLLQHGIRGTSPGPWPPLLHNSSMPDATLDKVERDLRDLDRIRPLLHESVIIEIQRLILSQRFT